MKYVGAEVEYDWDVAISISDKNKALIAFQRTLPFTNVFAAMLFIGNDSLTPVFPISFGTADGNSYPTPRFVANTTWIVGYQNWTVNDYFLSISYDDGLTWGDFPIPALAGAPQVIYPRLDVNSLGDVVIVWDLGGSVYYVQYIVVNVKDKNGALTATPSNLNPSPTLAYGANYSFPTPVRAGRNAFVVVYLTGNSSLFLLADTSHLYPFSTTLGNTNDCYSNRTFNSACLFAPSPTFFPSPSIPPSPMPSPDFPPSPVPSPDFLPSPLPSPDFVPSPNIAPSQLPSPDVLPSPIPSPDVLPSLSLQPSPMTFSPSSSQNCAPVSYNSSYCVNGIWIIIGNISSQICTHLLSSESFALLHNSL
jgi:hypothetical protein